jgi:tetratricopeptide (TPR) repeat protein
MSQKRRIIILGSIVVVVIGASIAAAIYFSQLQNKSSSSNNSSDGTSGDKGSTLPQQKPAEKTADAADKTAYEGDVKGGVKQLDDAISNTSDNEELYIFYSRKATLLINNNMLADALVAAKKAYELHISSDSAALVGQIAQQQGDKTLSIEYYKKAIEHIDKNDPFADEDKTYYQQTITDMGGAL